MRIRHIWTPQMDRRLRMLYPITHLPVSDIAHTLGVTKSAVRGRAYLLGVHRHIGRGRPKLPMDVETPVREMYVTTKARVIAKMLGCKTSMIYKTAHNLGITKTIRTKKQQ